jgi:hypothetical protein
MILLASSSHDTLGPIVRVYLRETSGGSGNLRKLVVYETGTLGITDS